MASAHMGASRAVGSRLLNFLSDTVSRGSREALRSLNLEQLSGRPIEQVFIGLSDFVCPHGGSIDEGIARAAFIETITELAAAGVTNLDGLTANQIQIVFELYATNAIEGRLCNDIGTKIVIMPSDVERVGRVQEQLHDFIRRSVADALAKSSSTPSSFTPDNVLAFVGSIYEQAFEILRIMGETEADTK